MVIKTMNSKSYIYISYEKKPETTLIKKIDLFVNVYYNIYAVQRLTHFTLKHLTSLLQQRRKTMHNEITQLELSSLWK